MFAAVIPAQNEEARIGLVIRKLLKLPLDIIIPVVNGCQDRTLQSCISIPSSKIFTIHFKESLGIDIPRAVGAFYAKQLGVNGILFIDGDMTGNFTHSLEELILSIKSGIDCALTNCYPYIYDRHPLAKKVLRYRELLNRKMGLFHELGLASPSHGPHTVSKKLLRTIPIESFAVPPIELVLANQNNLSVVVATAITHQNLKSSDRTLTHTTMIANTIIGDCIEGLAILSGTPRHRKEKNISYDGYNSQRRFDLLYKFCEDPNSTEFFCR